VAKSDKRQKNDKAKMKKKKKDKLGSLKPATVKEIFKPTPPPIPDY
jgi:hypothetical protein